MSPLFSLLSFLTQGVLFHHDLLIPLGSGWGSGACLPSSLFFLSSGKGFCSIVICWFFLVPAGVPVLVSLLLSSLVPRVCLPSSLFFLSSGQGFCSIMICWFLLVPAGVPVFCLPSSLLWFRCLSPFFSLLSFLRKGVLFHHDLLVPLGSGWGSGACLLFFSLLLVPVLVSLLLFCFLSSGKGFCSIMICWLLLVLAGVPVRVSLVLSSFFPQQGVLFHHDLLIPLGSGWGSGACLPSSLFFGSGARLLLSSFFPQERVLFHHDLLIPLGSGWGSGPCLPSSLFFGSGACLPSSLFFLSSGQGFCSIMIWLVPLGSGWGSGVCLPYSLFFGSGACLSSSLFFFPNA